MGPFIIGVLLVLACVVGCGLGRKLFPVPYVTRAASGILGIIGLVVIVFSTTLYVEDNQGGVVVRKFGQDLAPGKIIATDGEKGPQAKILPPGWHFWYWPWIYDLEPSNNEDIQEGSIGLVTARDGKPLPEGDVYAQAWESPQEMLDAVKFLSGNGYKGPQLTVLPPGQYRYNPRLFKIEKREALNVPIGKVAVIKANAGPTYEPKEGEEVEVVNGVPIVPKGFRGIWKEALPPNKYYMHPNAYEVTYVQTVKRVYSYTAGSVSKSDRPGQDNSMGVRTKDGFQFPVDVRVSVKISAANAPYNVAMLQDPDGDPNGDGFDILEERAVLPSLRSIFRNSAEDKGGLEYVNSRSVIESDATEKFRTDMKQYKVEVDAVYVASIGLDRTPEGKKLLQTQTDMQIALREQDTYKEQVKAEQERAEKVKAEEAANQQKAKQEAAAQEEIKDSLARAKEKEARGDAAYNKAQIEAMGGVENYVTLRIAEMLIEKLPQTKLPSTVVVGGGGGGQSPSLDALLALLLKAQVQE